MKARIWKHQTWGVWFASVPDESGFGFRVFRAPEWDAVLAQVLSRLDAQRAVKA